VLSLLSRMTALGKQGKQLRDSSKNNSMHSERPVHETHRTLERKLRIRMQPWYDTKHERQPNAGPKTQDVPDAAPNTQDAT